MKFAEIISLLKLLSVMIKLEFIEVSETESDRVVRLFMIEDGITAIYWVEVAPVALT